MSEAEAKDVSCFTVDGVVAEMMIEVEDNQKSADDLANSPKKDFSSIREKDQDSEKKVENDEQQPVEFGTKEKEDKENVLEGFNIDIKEDKNMNITGDIKEDKNMNKMEDKTMNKKEDKSTNQPLRKRRKIKLSVNSTKNKNEVTDMPRYPGRKRLANKRYISEDMITSKFKLKSQSKSLSKDFPSEVKRRKLETDVQEMKDVSDDKPIKVKRRKLETDVQEVKVVSDDKPIKKPLRNLKETAFSASDKAPSKLTEKKELPSHVKTEKEKESSQETKIEIDQPKTKQDILRKLPFRKNKNAPDVPDLKPKVFWWNGVGEGEGIKLKDIPDVRERIKSAKSVRALYRVLFYQWPTNGQDLIGQILEFNGFPFDKSSYEFSKRQNLMKILLENTISNICDILDVRKGDKQSMINNILDFLIKPYKKVDPALDPSLQPVVVLEKIQLDTFFDQTSEVPKTKRGTRSAKSKVLVNKVKEKTVESKPVTPVPVSKIKEKSVDSKRVTSVPVSKIKEKAVESKPVTAVRKTRNSSLKRKDSVDKKSNTKPNKLAAKATLKQTHNSVSKPNSTENITETKKSKSKVELAVKDAKESFKAKKPEIEEKLKTSSKSADEIAMKPKKLKGFKKRKKFAKSRKAQIAKSIDNEKENEDDEAEGDHIDNVEDVEMEDEKLSESASVTVEKSEKVSEKESKLPESAPITLVKSKKESNRIESITSTILLSDSSETESAEETKLVTSPRKSGKVLRRKGKPLGHFTKISETIQKANFSALQRLHILLFGASDKADNLKTNILAFGGFPFLEGSDEWKQKHFLLSLLAQSNLREYLNLLCIEYSDDDQPTMINKLMKFLAAPSETAFQNKIQPIEIEVISSELTNKSPTALPPKGKTTAKKKVKKKEEKKTGPRHRKVLMSEDEARRLEASFAREQRAIARESKAPPPVIKSKIVTPVISTPSQTIQPKLQLEPKFRPLQVKRPVADPRQLNALLQTVYKRRALKAAGAVISTPNKGEKTKLGDIENIKFLIVTGNLSDLEILHHLIFMSEASKTKLRKNILDFDGFGFNEDCERYKERMNFLYSLGYDVSKRISFLLGLCSLQVEIPQQDLNELIMYFLMSPCKTKQVVPITEMPLDPSIGTSGESQIILKSIPDFDRNSHQNVLQASIISTPKQLSSALIEEVFQTSTPLPKVGHQKARKSFNSILKASPVKKVLLPPSQMPIVGATLSKQVIGNKSPITLLNSVPAVPSYSLANLPSSVTVLNAPNNIAVLNAAKVSNINSCAKAPVNPGTNVRLMSQGSNLAVIDAATKIPISTVSNAPGRISQNPKTFPQLSNKIGMQSQSVVPSSLSHGSHMILNNPSGYVSSPQEFLVQQQTPDGQQKTFKLIRLPANHPLASVVGKSSTQQPAAPAQVQQQVILTNTLPPGLVIMKNSSGLPSAGQNLQINLQNTVDKVIARTSIRSSESDANKTKQDEFIFSENDKTLEISGNSSKDDEDEEINPLPSLQDKSPTDEDLFKSIQEIILSSNFEDITLRNVIERVSGQYPHHDLTDRHNYMKDCVKKIIIGT